MPGIKRCELCGGVLRDKVRWFWVIAVVRCCVDCGTLYVRRLPR